MTQFSNQTIEKMINVDLLKEICEVAGAPGYEQRIREVVLREVGSLVDDVSVDNFGNVIALKKGRDSKKVMIAAHMDEIGFMVKHINKKGFIFFTTLGGFDPKTLTAQRVIIHGKEDVIGVMGSKPIHMMTSEERKRPLEIDDFFIDTGLPFEKVNELVEPGNPVTRQRELIEMGDCVNCKSIDNRVAVFILIEMLRELKNPPYDVYGVFTVQEEVGIRGAKVAALTISPDFGFGLDTTIAFDLPGSKPEEQCTKLGEGTAIKIMDASAICDYRMVKYMKQTAEKHNLKWQTEVLTKGGTDTAGIQQMSANGAIAGAVSIPTRHLHQVIEMANKNDIRESISLLKHSVLDLDRFDWKHR